jgi:spore coat polysaccharide biosynthesis protein SpsF (cytidylyltransferase family)
MNMIKKIYDGLKRGIQPVPLEDTISFLKKHPDIVTLNKDMDVKWRDNHDLQKNINLATTI